MFRLEAEAYEQERLAAMQTSVPTSTDQNDESPDGNTTGARQEGPTPAEIALEPTTTTTTEPNSEETANEPLGDTNQPASTNQPPSPTPQPEQPDHTPDPENILDILEEE